MVGTVGKWNWFLFLYACVSHAFFQPENILGLDTSRINLTTLYHGDAIHQLH